MPRSVTHRIPVYPLVLKYLSHHYDTAPFEVQRLGNPFATYLYACLDRHDYRDTTRARQPRKYHQLTGQLSIHVAPWRIKSFAANRISPDKISAFNDFVRQILFERLAQEVAMATFFGVGLKQATERFLSRYGITEDELSIDTALRYYARHRRKLMLEYCPENREQFGVILPHERDRANWQMESGRGQVA